MLVSASRYFLVVPASSTEITVNFPPTWMNLFMLHHTQSIFRSRFALPRLNFSAL